MLEQIKAHLYTSSGTKYKSVLVRETTMDKLIQFSRKQKLRLTMYIDTHCHFRLASSNMFSMLLTKLIDSDHRFLYGPS